MPTYKVTDPTTGKTVSLTGDSPPSEQELNDIFSTISTGHKETQTVSDSPVFPESTKRTISNVIRPTLEIGGGVIGGMLGGGAGAPTVAGVIPGVVAGGGLGFAAGRSAADLVDRGLGIKKPIQSLPEAIKETAGNIQSGAAMEAAGPAVGAVAKGIGTVAKGTGKALISATLGPSREAISARLARNSEIKSAKPFEELAKDLPNDLQKVSDKVSELSGKALDTLSTSKFIMEGAQAKDTLLNAIKVEKTSLGRSISDASSQAKKVLDRYAFRIRRMGNTVSEAELGQVVRDIDNDIDWSSKEMAPLNNALQGVRGKIDAILKSGNKDYADAMVPVAEGTELINKMKSTFHLQHDVGQGFSAGNTTATALKTATNKKSLSSRNLLENFTRFSGRDYLKDADNSRLAEQFVGGKTNGSRRVNLGAAIGSVAGTGVGSIFGAGGGLAGAAAGALGGSYIDVEGGRIAGSIIDQLARLGAITPRGTISPVFKRALMAAGVSQAGR